MTSPSRRHTNLPHSLVDRRKTMADDGPKEGEILFCGMTDWKMIGRG